MQAVSESGYQKPRISRLLSTLSSKCESLKTLLLHLCPLLERLRAREEDRLHLRFVRRNCLHFVVVLNFLFPLLTGYYFNSGSELTTLKSAEVHRLSSVRLRRIIRRTIYFELTITYYVFAL